MTSKIKVDNINKVSDDSNIIKKCGTTTTMTDQEQVIHQIVVDGSGSTVTIGRCGGTVALASVVQHRQVLVEQGLLIGRQLVLRQLHFTAANGEGYFVNTTGSGALVMNLPAGHQVLEEISCCSS